MKHIINKYSPSRSVCAFKHQKKGSPTALNWKQLRAAFLLLAVGLCLSTVTFILEVFIGKRRFSRR